MPIAPDPRLTRGSQAMTLTRERLTDRSDSESKNNASEGRASVPLRQLLLLYCSSEHRGTEASPRIFETCSVAPVQTVRLASMAITWSHLWSDAHAGSLPLLSSRRQ